MFTSRKELVIWLAGFLEGEGSFGIYRNGPGFLGRVSAGQVDLRPLEMLKSAFGGSVTSDKRSYVSRHSTTVISQWQLSGPSMKAMLIEIRPYLLMKAGPADCILELVRRSEEWLASRKTNKEKELTEEEWFARCLLHVRCTRLNKERVSAATTEREGSPSSEEISDSLNCIDGKDAEVAEMTTRLLCKEEVNK